MTVNEKGPTMGEQTTTTAPTELELAVQAAVQAERERIRGAIRDHMDRVIEHYEGGADDTARKRAYALGQMGALHALSGRIGDGILPVSPTTWYIRDCERLDV